MRISTTSKGDFENTLKWLDNVSKSNYKKTADQIANDGVRSLKANTPKTTGETANGWKASVKMTAKGLEISWYNTAHPEVRVNMAKLIELGHGTRTGGYVPPEPYIKQSMESIFKTAGDKIAGEMNKT